MRLRVLVFTLQEKKREKERRKYPKN
uniref:Uncharacterized protein n=1 Tax=Rhizophora mucronata TaxID=61149 RepID=A0A2P2QPP4_RHIMU